MRAERGAGESGETPYFTVGHSTRTTGEFVHLLRAGEVEFVADIRRLPGSRAYPRFDGPALEASLAEAGIACAHVPELGGRRPRQPEVPDEVNAFWRNRSFHNYADYALGDEFRKGLDRLTQWGAHRRVTVMCSEALWWRCHRRIVADHLLAAGRKVFHLTGADHVEPAHLTEAARRTGGGVLAYPGEGGG